jgi:AraC-like DNA-binding protein
MAKNTANNLSLAHSSGLISRLAYAHAKQAHANVAKLLKKSGLTLNDIDNVTIRIGAQKQIDFVELVAQTIGDSNLGFHLAREFDLRTIGLLYYVAASAKTLGDALQRAARCSATVNDGISLAIRQGRSLKVTFKYSAIARYTDRQQIAFWITALVRVAQHLTNRNVHPLRIRLVHHKPDTTGELKSFFGAQIEGDCPVDMVEFAASTWTLPIVNADPYLHRLLLRVCEETLVRRQLRGGPFRIRVENAIVELLPHGHAKVENVAAKLHMRAKKLARQLSAERLTFSKVLRELRGALARRYLADPDLSVSQIAWLLGYKETAAFTHAFRGWTGTSPRAARTRGYLRKF